MTVFPTTDPHSVAKDYNLIRNVSNLVESVSDPHDPDSMLLEAVDKLIEYVDLILTERGCRFVEYKNLGVLG